MTGRPIRSAMLLLIALAAVTAPGLRAQAPGGAFAEMRLSAGGVENSAAGALRPGWRPSRGWAVRLESPVDTGFLELGMRFLPYAPRDAENPAFDALLLHAGWGIAWQPAPALRVSGAARVGNLYLRFDERGDPYARSESELAVGAAARVELHPVPFLGVYAEAAQERVFTAVRMNLRHVSGGLVVRLRTPSPVRRLLQ